MAMSINEMLFVVALGLGTVFVGLISIIILCKIIGLFCKGTVKSSAEEKSVVSVTPVVPQKIENRQEIIAAVSAVVAEELGKDISAIRVLSFKKI